MSECVDLGEEVRDKESGRPVVFDSLPLYNHVQRSLRFAQDDNAKQLPRYARMTRIEEKSDSSSVPRRDDNSSRAAPLP